MASRPPRAPQASPPRLPRCRRRSASAAPGSCGAACGRPVRPAMTRGSVPQFFKAGSFGGTKGFWVEWYFFFVLCLFGFLVKYLLNSQQQEKHKYENCCKLYASCSICGAFFVFWHDFMRTTWKDFLPSWPRFLKPQFALYEAGIWSAIRVCVV